jgi:hypothetical protein
MEDATHPRGRLFKLERRFEQTHLEHDFLACAYEHRVAVVQRPAAIPRPETSSDIPQCTNQNPRIAIGA